MRTIDEEMNTQFAEEKYRLFANVVYTGNWIRSQFDAFIKPFDLSSPQFNILRILRGAKDWIAISIVKDKMVEKSPNTTRLCDKLHDKGLLTRRRGAQDRRVVHLKISDKGLQLLKKIDEADDGTHMGFSGNVSNKEAKIVNEVLDKLRG